MDAYDEVDGWPGDLEPRIPGFGEGELRRENADSLSIA